MAALRAMAPSFGAERLARPPCIVPTGVRATLTITTSLNLPDTEAKVLLCNTQNTPEKYNPNAREREREKHNQGEARGAQRNGRIAGKE